MAATLKLLPTEPVQAEPVRTWNLTDLLRRVAADDGAAGEPRADEEAVETLDPALAEAVSTRAGTEPAVSALDHSWTDAVDLATEAAEAITLAEERIARLEADNRQLESYLEKEVRALQASMKAADEIVQRAEAAKAAAEARAERAEERAAAAEICLSRIRSQLSPIRRTRPAAPATA